MAEKENEKGKEQQEEAPEAPVTKESGEFGYSLDGRGHRIIDLGDGPVDLGRDVPASSELLPKPTLDPDVAEELERGREARRQLEEVEPLIHLTKREDFQEYLKEKIAEGVIPDPTPRPGPDDVAGYFKRREDPEAERVLGAMRHLAEKLPPDQADLLDNNEIFFNETFDRIKSSLGPTPPPPGGFASPVDPNTMEKIIQSKEVRKEWAKVESPGSVRPETPPRNREREIQKVRAQLRQAPPGQQDMLEGKLAQLLYGGDE
jgi:hypothetical protein